MVHDHTSTATPELDGHASQNAGDEAATEKNELKLSAQQKKLMNSVASIREHAPKELSFGIDFLADTCLPISDPGSDTRIYIRKNGNLTLEIQPAYIRNADGTSEFVFPYGSVPRRILIWAITEALRTKNPKLYLGASLNDFISNKLRLSIGGAQVKSVRKQTVALFRAQISVTSFAVKGETVKEEFESFQIATSGRLLTHMGATGQDPDENESSYLVLDQRFYERIVGTNGRHGKAFPVDMRVVEAIGNDALALDVYLWTVLRVYRADRGTKAVCIPWERLHSQFGADIQEKKRFKQKFIKAINKVGLLYPGLNFESDRKNFTLLPSALAIEERQLKSRKPKLKAGGGR